MTLSKNILLSFHYHFSDWGVPETKWLDPSPQPGIWLYKVIMRLDDLTWWWWWCWGWWWWWRWPWCWCLDSWMVIVSKCRRNKMHVLDSSTLLYLMMMMLRMVVMMTMMLMSCLRRNNLHVVDSSTLLYASGNLLHFLNTDTNKLRCVSIFVFLRPKNVSNCSSWEQKNHNQQCCKWLPQVSANCWWGNSTSGATIPYCSN